MQRYAATATIAVLVLVGVWIGLSHLVRLSDDFFAPAAEKVVNIMRSGAPEPLSLPTPDERLACAMSRQSWDHAPPRQYFPERPANVNPLSPRHRDGYSNVLCVLGEPSLSPPPRGQRRIRLLHSGPFNYAFVIRIEVNEKMAVLHAARTSPNHMQPPSISRSSVQLTQDQFLSITRQIDEIGFWRLPTTSRINAKVLDGYGAVLEISEWDRYHVIDRVMGGEIRGLDRYLAKLVDIENL